MVEAGNQLKKPPVAATPSEGYGEIKRGRIMLLILYQKALQPCRDW